MVESTSKLVPDASPKCLQREDRPPACRWSQCYGRNLHIWCPHHRLLDLRDRFWREKFKTGRKTASFNWQNSTKCCKITSCCICLRMIGSKSLKYVHFLQKFGRWDLKFRCPTLVVLFSGSMVSVFPCVPRFFLHSKTSQKGILMSPNNLYVWRFLKVNPSKHCLFPTHFQCHLLRFACSVVGKN